MASSIEPSRKNQQQQQQVDLLTFCMCFFFFFFLCLAAPMRIAGGCFDDFNLLVHLSSLLLSPPLSSSSSSSSSSSPPFIYSSSCSSHLSLRLSLPIDCVGLLFCSPLPSTFQFSAVSPVEFFAFVVIWKSSAAPGPPQCCPSAVSVFQWPLAAADRNLDDICFSFASLLLIFEWSMFDLTPFCRFFLNGNCPRPIQFRSRFQFQCQL